MGMEQRQNGILLFRPLVVMQAEEKRVEEELRHGSPREVFQRLISENDAQLRQSGLDNGRELAAARTAIYTAMVRHWAAEQVAAFGYDQPFAVVALGGTGRGEMTPCSDNDFAFLFKDALERNPFLLHLQKQVLHTDEFANRYGFSCLALPFSLDDVPTLSGKQLNAFLDMRPVYDPHGLADLFRKRIRATYDPFGHFLHVRSFWKDQLERAAAESERLDCFDIKNSGLRVFLAGIWTLAGKNFVHSHQIYTTLDDVRDLEAYYFLLRIRSFIHLRRATRSPVRGAGNHAEDVLGFEDFLSFGQMLGPDADERARFEFANEVRARLLAARRRVARFAKGVIERELKIGRPISHGSPIVYGSGGLCHTASGRCSTPEEKSRAALSLLLASQHYGVPIDPTELNATFRNAGDWLVPVPELGALFYETEGSLADSFAFLAQFDGAEERLFPGYAKYEASLDGRVMAEGKTLRGVHERRKIQYLETLVREGRKLLEAAGASSQAVTQGEVNPALEAALLDTDSLAAIKLALKTKRLPLTAEDIEAREDASRPLHERYSTGLSEIPLAEYYQRYAQACDFTAETLQTAEFLVANRRAFKQYAAAGPNDQVKVKKFAELCQSEERLRALFVFTCADRAEWENEAQDPVRWFNSRELYAKALEYFHPVGDHARELLRAGYSAEERKILEDFGEDFFNGIYRRHANRFGSHLVRLASAPESRPRASLLRDGASLILGVAARDYRGLAATISGALYARQVGLQQAHLFSAMNHGLALDFFHLAPSRTQPVPGDLAAFVEQAVSERRYIAASDEAALPRVTGAVSIAEWREGQFCLQFETAENTAGIIYAITYKVFRHLKGNIFGLSAYAVRNRAFISVYMALPPELSLEQARQIAAGFF